MAKIWAKDYELNELIELFTVGSDYILDQDLVASDCVASIAHGKMLSSIGILSEKEFEALKSALCQIIVDRKNDNFPISLSDEDCHTAIENRLIQTVGEAGKKIHTGRSRNDQVVTATRLYTKAFLLNFIDKALSLCDSFLILAKNHKSTPMPGRTHMQIAMPSSVGLWASSFAEDILDSVTVLKDLYNLIDQNPLGSAASYGVPLPLNRELTTKLLGFSRVQNNVLYANNSRGRFEARVLEAAEEVVITLSKVAADLILFSLPEFGYFSLPRALCSGSSIMPQKKNPDGLELMRAKAATFSSYVTQIKSIVRSLPSGYNRDFQETKEPFMKGTKLALQCLSVMKLTIDELEVNKEKLLSAFTPDIYATDMALDLVSKGKSFRDAYKEVGLALETVKLQDASEVIKNRRSTGTTGNLNLSYAANLHDSLKKENEARGEFFYDTLEKLVGFPVCLL